MKMTFDEGVAAGALVDLTSAARCCWRVGMTPAAYEDAVVWTDADGGPPWRQAERWAHLQQMLFYCAGARGDEASTSRPFRVLRVPRGGGCGDRDPELAELRMHVVGRDDALVISLPEESCPVVARPIPAAR